MVGTRAGSYLSFLSLRAHDLELPQPFVVVYQGWLGHKQEYLRHAVSSSQNYGSEPALPAAPCVRSLWRLSARGSARRVARISAAARPTALPRIRTLVRTSSASLPSSNHFSVASSAPAGRRASAHTSAVAAHRNAKCSKSTMGIRQRRQRARNGVESPPPHTSKGMQPVSRARVHARKYFQ